MIVQNKIEYRIILGMHLSPVNLDMGYIEMFIKIKNVLMGLHCMFEFKKMSFLPLKYFSSFPASLFRSKAISSLLRFYLVGPKFFSYGVFSSVTYIYLYALSTYYVIVSGLETY